MKLIKDQMYRITQKDGKKTRATFNGEGSLLGFKVFMFTKWGEMLIISSKIIKKIELVAEIISPDAQAREKGCWEEFLKYGMINGKTPRRKYVYKEVK
tara:strand:+ start:473 stop:766 length:294 start_codon:yes stop_codon:yes gene_type:complete